MNTITTEQREELKAAAINALEHEHRHQSDHNNAMFALKLKITPELILTLLGEEIPETPIKESEEEE